MDKKQIQNEIAALINNIKEHSDNISQQQHIPQLELELILQKIEALYKKSIVFNYLNAATSIPALNDQEKSAENKIEQASLPVENTAIEIKEEKKEVSNTVTQQKPADLFGSELPIVTEKPKAEKREAKKEEKPLISKIQKPALSDIKSAIGINDKFQFANELFGGNMQEYEIAIQQLNTAETINSASEYFMSIQQLYNWDSENETVKRLFDLVERRYS